MTEKPQVRAPSVIEWKVTSCGVAHDFYLQRQIDLAEVAGFDPDGG